jgi:hypothetical protein
MPPKQRKPDQDKRKKQKSTSRAHSRKKTIKAGTKPSKKRGVGKTAISNKRRGPRKRAAINAVGEIERENRKKALLARRGAGLQPDFQGLSREEEADSESVEELVEEGNILESGAVAGVEQADNEDEKEVHTRELPEDDVPEEYLEEK